MALNSTMNEKHMLGKAIRLVKFPLALALIVTSLRFFGERADWPSLWTFFLGIIWLTLFVGVYWGFKLSQEDRPFALLCLSLLLFSWLSRIPVVVLWWITTRFSLGTHYDMYQDLSQALVFQFGVSTLVQVAFGAAFGGVALAFARSRQLAKHA